VLYNIAQPKKTSEMQTKNWPVQNMHLKRSRDACFEQARFFLSSTKKFGGFMQAPKGHDQIADLI
jgi:hypothetical protein